MTIEQFSAGEAVDQLAQVRAQIAALKTQESDLRADIIANADDGVLEGDQFLAKIIESIRNQVDYKAIVAKLQPSHQLMTAHTKQIEVTSVRLSAKPQEVMV